MKHDTDIAIIGAGPVGLFASIQAGLMGMKSCVIDALEYVGGQCAALYPEKPIHDIPAHESILASELVKKLEEQAQKYKPELLLEQRVVSITKHEDGFILKTSKDNEVRARSVIIAIGNGAFVPNKPPIDGLELYEGKSIFYKVERKNDFKDKDVAIFGGGDAAVDWTIFLSEVAKSVTLVHRRDAFRCIPGSMDKLHALRDAGKIKMEVPCQLSEVEGHDGAVTSVTIKDKEGNKKKLSADALLFFFGLSIDLGSVLDCGLEFDKRRIKVDQVTMSTNIPGIYAAGDIVGYEGKLKSIVIGFAESVRACRSAHAYLNPKGVRSDGCVSV